MATGQYLCEAVEYEVDGPPGEVRYCHCSQCRRASGPALGELGTLVDLRTAVRKLRVIRLAVTPISPHTGTVTPWNLPKAMRPKST